VSGDVAIHEEGTTRMKPVILENVTASMGIYDNESLGPSVSIITAIDDDEAIRIANDTEYGLTSAVFTEDLRRGLKMAKRIQTGAVHINSMIIHDETVLPHGGVKRSGIGRFNALGGTGMDQVGDVQRLRLLF
jgi:acyl-CoA reductase-like NAD-dependent aldehyde dehydrogenase